MALALVALLCKWASGLQGGAAARAKRILAKLLAVGLKHGELVWPCPASSSPSPAMAMPSCLHEKVHNVKIIEWAVVSSTLQEALGKRFHQQFLRSFCAH